MSVSDYNDNKPLTGHPGSTVISSNKRVKPKSTRPEVKIEWNNRAEQDYLDKGFSLNDLPVNIAYNVDDKEVKRFLSEVDISKAPIERNVYRMFRIRAIDYDYSSPKRERKEYLYYEENWNEGPDHWAKNRFGGNIAPVMAHLEGVYHETLTNEVVTTEVNDQGVEEEFLEYKFNGLRPRYYIPWSKKTAKDIIAKSAYSNEKGILFVVKIGSADYPTGGPGLRTTITTDMFLNWTWDELFAWMTRPAEQSNNFGYTRPLPVFKAEKVPTFKPS